MRAGDRFQAGPWTLGRWGRPVGIVATIWVVFISVLFMLPQALPINISTSTTRRSCSSSCSAGPRIWYAVSAKNWFKGPKVQGTPEELAAIEAELDVDLSVADGRLPRAEHRRARWHPPPGSCSFLPLARLELA